MSRQFLEKSYVICGMFWFSMIIGLLFGQTPGMISSLLKNEDGLNLTENEISLITSIMTVACAVGFGLVAITNDKIGRRWSCILFSIPVTLNWIILYFARSMSTLMLSRVIAGIGVGAIINLYISATSEYTSPKTRVFIMNLVTTVASAFSTGLGHYLGLILHWRTVALICGIASMIGTILPYFWVESPQWLATQGRFEECRRAFKKLNVLNTETMKELRILIKMENSKIDNAAKTNAKSSFKRLLVAVRRRYFWELMLITCVMFLYLTAASKLVFSALATVVLEEITGTTDIMLFTLAVDAALLFGAALSCVLIRRTTVRALLFTSGFMANGIMFILSILMYYRNESALSRWSNVSLLGVYFTLINSGPFPIFEALIGEMFPLDLKLYFIFFLSIASVTVNGAALMLFPRMIRLMGYHGYFLMNAIIMSACLIYLWVKLPETKGKMLQEIEVYMKVKDFDVDKVLDNEQIKALI